MAKEKRQKEEETVRCRFIKKRFKRVHYKRVNRRLYITMVFEFIIIDAGTTKSSSADDAASDSGTAKSAK